MANTKIILALHKTKAPYNVNSISQALGIKALKNKNKMLKFKAQILNERKTIEKELIKMNLPVFKSDSNFLVFKIKNASKIYKILAERYGIILRDRSKEPKMKDCIRMTVGTPEQNKKFIKYLKIIYAKS